MPTPWRLFNIDFSSGERDEYSESYRKRREEQISNWKKENLSSTTKDIFESKGTNVARFRQLDVTHSTRRQENADYLNIHTPAPKLQSSKKNNFEKSRKTHVASDVRKKSDKSKKPSLKSRVQKAKDNFTRNHKKFLVNAVEKCKQDQIDMHLDIPNLTSASKMSFESLSFPKQILQQLGDKNGVGHDGKLCNLEEGWLPSEDLDELTDDDSFHILPYQIKQPKTIDERKKERKLRKMEKRTDKKKFDPIVDLPYLFA